MSVNAAQIEFWNSDATRMWSERHEPVDRMFAGLTARVLDQVAPRPGERVLDIGCATGTTAMAIAERVAPDGDVLGIDIAERSIARAGERIAASGLRNVRVALADASAHPFAPGSFELMFSRFGVMFFVDPVATFNHLRGAMAANGRFVAMAFRSAAENVWASGPIAALRDVLPPDPAADPAAPGQFAWASAERVQSIFRAAGWRETVLTPIDTTFTLAEPGDAAGAASRALTVGPVARRARELPEIERHRLVPLLENWFREREGPDGVALPAAIWLVRATPS
ncbi:MAG: class I SAM-dependent methyltransferase [Acetobacteraceae bacterium]|nr:class I SAM-dependent methyltransferase [Acetobacteraceae bacterium]